MARKKSNELAAGIFVVGLLVVLVGVIVWMGGAKLFRAPKQEAVFYVSEQHGSVGLLKGSFVQIGDDQIGTISQIRFDPDSGNTLYYAQIGRSGIEIHQDANAMVAAGLIGGARLIITSRGTAEAPLADEANPVSLGGGLDSAMSNLTSAIEKINQMIDRELNISDPNALLAMIRSTASYLESTMKRIEGETDRAEAASALAKIHVSLDDVNAISASINSETDANNDKALLAKVHGSVDDINVMTADAKPKVNQTLTDVRDTAAQIREYTKKDIAELLAKFREANTNILKITNDFSAVSGQVREIVFLNRDNIDEMIDNMALVSSNLKAASAEIRRNPWRLIHQPDDKELDSQNLYDAARAFSNGATELDQAIAKMTGLVKAHPEGVKSDDPTLKKVREQLEEAFDKFQKVEQALWKEVSK